MDRVVSVGCKSWLWVVMLCGGCPTRASEETPAESTQSIISSARTIRDTEGLCGGVIDDEFKSAWQQYWQVGWVSAFKNMSSVNTQLAISLGQAAAIAHETASSDKLASRIHYGN